MMTTRARRAGLGILLAAAIPAGAAAAWGQQDYGTRAGCLAALRDAITQQQISEGRQADLERLRDQAPDSAHPAFDALLAAWGDATRSHAAIVDRHLELCQSYAEP